jgi:hypothetical protein
VVAWGLAWVGAEEEWLYTGWRDPCEVKENVLKLDWEVIA